MKEYFVSYYRIDYPICRACWNIDFDTIQIQKNKDCFTAFSDNCDERRPYCNWSNCNSCHCTCLTEPCPLQKRVLHCRCSIGELLENEIEYFERKSHIEENPDYVLHKDIALETIDEKHEHIKSLQEFSRYCEERGSGDLDLLCFFRQIPQIDSMVQFIILAQEIRALRKKEPAITVKPIESDIGGSPPIFVAANTEKKKSAVELYNEGKPLPEPDSFVLEEIDTSALTDIEQAVYSGTLRANIDSKNPDEKYRRWVKWKSGVGYTDIAKSENPEWESEYGREEAQRLWTSEADKIRKQVERFDKQSAISTKNERKT